jgi:hypothetical protein
MGSVMRAAAASRAAALLIAHLPFYVCCGAICGAICEVIQLQNGQRHVRDSARGARLWRACEAADMSALPLRVWASVALVTWVGAHALMHSVGANRLTRQHITRHGTLKAAAWHPGPLVGGMVSGVCAAHSVLPASSA